MFVAVEPVFGARKNEKKGIAARISQEFSEDDILVGHVDKMSKAICDMASNGMSAGVWELEVKELVRGGMEQTLEVLNEFNVLLKTIMARLSST